MKNPPISKTLVQCVQTATRMMSSFPDTLLALLARFSIAAVFWTSGQTKVDGFKLNFVNGEFSFHLPRLADSAIALFQDEYKLPFLSPDIAAPMAAFAEHFFPVMILMGLATRFSALGLLFMTLVIQIFVYPSAYPTHGTWAAVLLYLVVHGPGEFSLDHWLGKRYALSVAR